MARPQLELWIAALVACAAGVAASASSGQVAPGTGPRDQAPEVSQAPEAGRRTPAEQFLTTRSEVGKRGGRLVVSLKTEPKTFNPVTAVDDDSLTVIYAMNADLVHIDRGSQRTAPALASSWTASSDGRRYTLELRRGLSFSDGRPFDADDVIFTFRVYLDPEIAAPQRELLVVGGEPIQVRKVDTHTVELELAEPYAAAERLFDGFAILPRHLLEGAYLRGELARAWDPGTPPAQIAGLGPFRLKQHRPGEHLILERNPYYWKQDAAGSRLPYLDQLVFQQVATQDAQVLRFRAGELDAVGRLTAESFSQLEREAERGGFRVVDAGPGLDYNFLFFNLNPVNAEQLPEVARRQLWFRQKCFRRAVSSAIDRQGLVRLIYRDHAAPLTTHVTPGNQRWIHRELSPPARSIQTARRLLEDCGFGWSRQGELVDAEGRRVEFAILTPASSSQRQRMATIVQEDLRELGIEVRVAALEFQAVLERLFQSHDYDACILGLSGGDADPNPAMSLLLSGGGHHLWHLGQSEPATPWEREIDLLMRRQLVTLDAAERKRLYDRVQEIVAEELPFIGLVSPNVLVGAKVKLGNFRPAVLEPHTLWNVEELFWR